MDLHGPKLTNSRGANFLLNKWGLMPRLIVKLIGYSTLTNKILKPRVSEVAFPSRPSISNWKPLEDVFSHNGGVVVEGTNIFRIPLRLHIWNKRQTKQFRRCDCSGRSKQIRRKRSVEEIEDKQCRARQRYEFYFRASLGKLKNTTHRLEFVCSLIILTC